MFLALFDVSVIYYWTDARQRGIYLFHIRKKQHCDVIHASVLQLIIISKNHQSARIIRHIMWKRLDCNVNIQNPQFDFQITCALLSAISLSLISALDRLQFAARQVYFWILWILIAIFLLIIFQICTNCLGKWKTPQLGNYSEMLPSFIDVTLTNSIQ